MSSMLCSFVPYSTNFDTKLKKSLFYVNITPFHWWQIIKLSFFQWYEKSCSVQFIVAFLCTRTFLFYVLILIEHNTAFEKAFNIMRRDPFNQSHINQSTKQSSFKYRFCNSLKTPLLIIWVHLSTWCFHEW